MAKAKKVLAHTILKLFGLRISNLKYVPFVQIDNLYKGKQFKIIPIKSNNVDKLSFEYTKEMIFILKKAEYYYKYIKDNWDKVLKENAKKELQKPYQDKNIPKTDILELWHPIYMTREYLTRSINKDLKIAGLILNKHITSRSYRRGISIIITKLNRIKAAKDFLNHANIGTTQFYASTKLTLEEKKGVMKNFLNVNNYNEIANSPDFDDLYKETIDEEIEKIVGELDYASSNEEDDDTENGEEK